MVGSAAPQPTLSARDREILLGYAARIDSGDAGGHNNLGVLYFNKGLIGEAVEQFHLALEIDPAMPVALRNVEIAYLSTGYYERVAAELTGRLREFPGDRVARWRLARAHRHSGRIDEARAELRRLLAIQPDDARVLVEIGRAEKDAGAFEDARRAYERALQIDPTSAVLHFHLGELHYHQGNSEEARRVLLRAIELTPAFAEAYHLLSFVLGDLGESERATAAMRRARELGPWLAEAQTGLSIDRHSRVRYVELVGDRKARPEALRDRFLAHYHLGIAFRQQGMYDEALREFGRALERGEDRRLVLQAEAEVLLVAGRDDEAVELYRTLIRDEPGSAKLWNELGVCHHRAGDLTQAETCYQRSLRADETYVIAQNNAGIARANRGDTRGARRLLESAVEARPGFTEALCNLGLLAHEEGRRREALESFRAAVAADPHCAAGWLGLGAILSETDELKEARQALVRAVEIEPDSAEARYRLAFLLNRTGDIEGSLRETQRALALNPYFAAPRPRLAIELQFEYAEVLAPEISTDTRLAPEEEVRGFAVTKEEISGIFAGLRAPQHEVRDVSSSSYQLAEDYLSKGLLARAMAEVRRVAIAGGDRVTEALLAGEIFRVQNLEGEALERFDAALELLGGSTTWTAQHEKAWVGRGRCLLKLGRLGEVLETAAHLVRHAGPAHAEAIRLEADALFAMGENEAAMERFTTLTQSRPHDPPLLMRLGTAARAAGHPEIARDAFGRALDLDADLIAARVELGAICLAEGSHGEAISHGQTALNALPGYAEAALLVAEAERLRGNLDAAVGVLADLLVDDPYHVEVILRLGDLLFAAERPADAIVAFRRALRFDPENADAWVGLGESYLAAGEPDEAAECSRRGNAHGADSSRAETLWAAVENLIGRASPARRTA